MTDKSIGQIAYEAAARLTKCNQPWSEANQLKWEGAAKAVHDIAIKSPEAAEYWSDKHCKAVRTRLSALKMQQIWEKPDCIVEAAEQAIRESK